MELILFLMLSNTLCQISRTEDFAVLGFFFLTFTAQKSQLVAWQAPPDILFFSVPGEGQLMVQEMMWSPVHLYICRK